MKAIEIRKFDPKDAGQIRNLITQILRDEFPEERQAFPVGDIEDISASYGKLGEAFFVASSNGKVVRTVGIKQDDERTALLRRLYVDSEYRGHHVGERLADRAIEFCREVGYAELIFKTTASMQSAIELGKKKGFITKGRIHLGSVELVKLALFLKNSALEI